VSAFFAIVKDGRVVETGEGEPGDIYTDEEKAAALRFDSLEAFEQDALVAEARIARWWEEDLIELGKIKSQAAYAAKELEARRWLSSEPEPTGATGGHAWRARLSELEYPYLYDECDVRELDPWVVARAIIDAVERTTDGDMGTRARERARIERRERGKRTLEEIRGRAAGNRSNGT